MKIYSKDFKAKGENYNNIRISCDYENRRYRLYAIPETIENEKTYVIRKTDSDAMFNGVCQTILTVQGRKSKKSDQEALDIINGYINIVLNTICERFNLKLEN